MSSYVQKSQVGFIGLGNMGGPMAANLITKVGLISTCFWFFIDIIYMK